MLAGSDLSTAGRAAHTICGQTTTRAAHLRASQGVLGGVPGRSSSCCILVRISRAARSSLLPVSVRRMAVMALCLRTGIQQWGPRKASVSSLCVRVRTGAYLWNLRACWSRWGGAAAVGRQSGGSTATFGAVCRLCAAACS